ncbi:hypothetical protein HLB44_00505 [Aquincola sp. S2]|uniref:SnoaL-like domain-containing protein n=1 Tax=Pseudaquabacterium terrae TaxID=2732868 RepID=A0ABX2E944_9BURK|nr:hypothetical protein [Aquabacterium terrae]NRF65454.1 hypothetical protein [Aquabacterium terrae]
MEDHAATDPLSLALQWLQRPADWPQTAAALYDAAVCWRAPARGLLIEGRDAVLAHLCEDARRFAAAEQVVLRRVVAGTRLIDESALTFICPADGIAGVELTAGDRIELKRTRLLSFAGGLIVDELNLETWTVLQRAG